MEKIVDILIEISFTKKIPHETRFKEIMAAINKHASELSDALVSRSALNTYEVRASVKCRSISDVKERVCYVAFNIFNELAVSLCELVAEQFRFGIVERFDKENARQYEQTLKNSKASKIPLEVIPPKHRFC